MFSKGGKGNRETQKGTLKNVSRTAGGTAAKSKATALPIKTYKGSDDKKSYKYENKGDKGNSGIKKAFQKNSERATGGAAAIFNALTSGKKSYKESGDKKNYKHENKGSKENSGIKDILKNVGKAAAGGAAAYTATTLGTEVYKVSGEKEFYESLKFNKQSMENQAYEVLSHSDFDRKIRQKTKVMSSILDQAYKVSFNSDIDKRITQKTKEIELLRQKIDELEPLEIKKKKRKDIYNLLDAQILTKSYCLDILKKLKEKKESISQNLSKCDELTTELENISFLHPIKKSGIANEITVFEINVENDLSEYKALELRISENEKAEEVLTEQYNVMERKAIKGKNIGIFKVAVAIIGICIICGFIAFFGG